MNGGELQPAGQPVGMAHRDMQNVAGAQHEQPILERFVCDTELVNSGIENEISALNKLCGRIFGAQPIEAAPAPATNAPNAPQVQLPTMSRLQNEIERCAKLREFLHTLRTKLESLG